MADHVGQQLGTYRLIRLLGRGAFAEVYLAVHIVSGRQVAIKILDEKLPETNLERMRREGQAIAALDHPNIVQLLELDTSQGIPWLVMEYAPNGTLRDRYPEGSRLPVAQVVSYVQKLRRALEVMWWMARVITPLTSGPPLDSGQLCNWGWLTSANPSFWPHPACESAISSRIGCAYPSLHTVNAVNAVNATVLAILESKP